MQTELLSALEKVHKFVKRREKAWLNKPDSTPFYGEKFPGANLTLGDFRTLSRVYEQMVKDNDSTT